jgi:hypothetical protein
MRIFVALGAFLGLLASTRVAQAGNLDAFYLSGDAALIGGAITATARGGGSAWYNPAGLGHLRGLRLDASVNGYTLDFGSSPEIVNSDPNAKLEKLSSLDLTVVPAALTLTGRFGNVGVALGVFVPSQSTTILRSKVSVSDEDGDLAFAYDLYSRYQEYHVGPSFGWAPTDDLTLGASALVTYRTLQHIEDAFVSLEPGNIAVLSHYTRDWIQVGLELIVGMQWRVSSRLRMGAVVRTPAIRLGQDLQEVEAEVTAVRGLLDSAVNFSGNLGIEAAVVAPARLHAGFAYDLDNWRSAIDGRLLVPIKNDSLSLDLRPVLNMRLGATRQINDRFGVGGGIFTDRSPSRTPTTFGQSQLDFYGLTAGVTTGKLYKVISRGAEDLKEPHGLLFQTTVALSYALGVGTIVSAEVAAGPGGLLTYRDVPANIVAHEISVHLASTIAE